MECMCSLEDIDEASYCEYKTMPSGKWHPAKFSAAIVSPPEFGCLKKIGMPNKMPLAVERSNSLRGGAVKAIACDPE